LDDHLLPITTKIPKAANQFIENVRAEIHNDREGANGKVGTKKRTQWYTKGVRSNNSTPFLLVQKRAIKMLFDKKLLSPSNISSEIIQNQMPIFFVAVSLVLPFKCVMFFFCTCCLFQIPDILKGPLSPKGNFVLYQLKLTAISACAPDQSIHNRSGLYDFQNKDYAFGLLVNEKLSKELDKVG